MQFEFEGVPANGTIKTDPVVGRVGSIVDDPPDGSVCSVRNKKPRMSESAILVTQFLFAVVLEMTCNTIAINK